MSFLKHIFGKGQAAPQREEGKAPPPVKPAVAQPATSPPPGAVPVVLGKLVTEKATQLQVLRQYTFAVDRRAGKGVIAQAFRQRYGVKPQAVQVINVRSRPVRFGRQVGRTKPWRKAIITVPAGTTIDTEKTSG